MNKQINLRLPDKLLKSVKEYSEDHGYGSVQEFIKEIIREKLFDDDKFLQKIQQAKMKEVWDNKEDEAWENA